MRGKGRRVVRSAWHDAYGTVGDGVVWGALRLALPGGLGEPVPPAAGGG
ncbi:MAG: hypothetical protein LBD24_00415 [Spirochaetaceae bacterium]|nr:hypothetical protein [Spirochaetaceae bacterium]